MASTDRKIAVLGMGYVGAPMAALLADTLHDVVGVDTDLGRLEQIASGDFAKSERGLSDLLNRGIRTGRLQLSDKVESADVFIVAVPTPLHSEDGQKPDISFVETAVRQICSVLRAGNMVVIESTCPVGTTDRLVGQIAELRPELVHTRHGGGRDGIEVSVAYCPERILPGRILEELKNNPRVVGGVTPDCSERARQLYSRITVGEISVTTDAKTAEMIKLVENSYRDLNIAFANQLSLICESDNIDVWEVIETANQHPRVNVLEPGPGVGGHCIAVDPWFLVATYPDRATLTKVARELNEEKTEWAVKQVLGAIDQDIAHIAFYGLSFKAGVADLRTSPALKIVLQVGRESNVCISVVEPYLKQLPQQLSKCQLTTIAEAETADLHVMLVDHPEFIGMKPPPSARLDFRGVWR